jgi:pimeloyl-ACP methyl ester carboxylesterase
MLHATILSPPLILLHGLLGSGRNWLSVAEAFAPERRVLTPDLCGHGDSPSNGPLDIPGLAADIASLIARENLPQADLLGHSLGGKAAMWLALTRPEKVRRLIVVDIAPVSYPDHRANFGRLLDSLENLPLESLQNRADADERLTAAIPERGLRQFLLQNLVYRDGRYVWRVDLARIRAALPNLTGFPDTDNLPPFPGSTLFLGGGRSGYLLAEHLPLIEKLFPRAEIRRIADAGHWPHVEQPQEFLATAQSFLA